MGRSTCRALCHCQPESALGVSIFCPSEHRIRRISRINLHLPLRKFVSSPAIVTHVTVAPTKSLIFTTQYILPPRFLFSFSPLFTLRVVQNATQKAAVDAFPLSPTYGPSCTAMAGFNSALHSRSRIPEVTQILLGCCFLYFEPAHCRHVNS